MKIIYTTEKIIYTDYSIFLAGPSPRGINTGSWRLQALKVLKKLNFNGDVYNPEERVPGSIDFSKAEYPADWEHAAIAASDILIFWIPRNVKTLPGFTTNVEFGIYVPQKYMPIVYGRPDNAEKIKYLDWLWKKERPGVSIFNTLENTLQAALQILPNICRI